MNRHASIPSYRLYGEQQAWPTPELLHHESIAERSRIHDWTIRPHRHPDLYQMLYIRSGQAGLNLDGRESGLALPCLLMIPPVSVHGFSFSRDIDGHVVTFPDFVLHNFLAPASDLLDLFSGAGVLEGLKGQGAVELDGHFRELEREYTINDPARILALEARLGMILVLFTREIASQREPDAAVADRGVRHLRRFQALIEEHFRGWLSIEDYAAALGITTTQLNNICRTRAGSSALQLVHERVVLEAKRNLVYTFMTVSEIAYALGFSDPAYFSRFFNKRVGVPPSVFRARRLAVR